MKAKALIHYSEAGEPSGVWWMTGTRGQPQSFYLRAKEKTRGAVEIFGPDYDGRPFTLANWQYLLERLPESSSPFSSWEGKDYSGDPRDLLA